MLTNNNTNIYCSCSCDEKSLIKRNRKMGERREKKSNLRGKEKWGLRRGRKARRKLIRNRRWRGINMGRGWGGGMIKGEGEVLTWRPEATGQGGGMCCCPRFQQDFKYFDTPERGNIGEIWNYRLGIRTLRYKHHPPPTPPLGGWIGEGEKITDITGGGEGGGWQNVCSQ